MRHSEIIRNPITIGQMVRNLRVTRGVILKDFERIIGVSESYLSRIEKDKQTPSLKVMIRIIKELKADDFILMNWIYHNIQRSFNNEGLQLNMDFKYSITEIRKE